MTDHINDLHAAQRIDDRALYAPLRQYRDTYTVPLNDAEAAAVRARDDVSTAVHINTDGMSVAECCTTIGADYPRKPRRDTNPGLGLLIIAVSAVLSIAALVHFAGWLGWLS